MIDRSDRPEVLPVVVLWSPRTGQIHGRMPDGQLRAFTSAGVAEEWARNHRPGERLVVLSLYLSRPGSSATMPTATAPASTITPARPAWLDPLAVGLGFVCGLIVWSALELASLVGP